MESLNFVASFASTVLTSTQWHNLQRALKGNSSLLKEIVMVPFFLPAILAKSFVLATLASILTTLGYPMLAIALPLTLLTYQAVLQKAFGFRNADIFIGAVANLSTTARPVTHSMSIFYNISIHFLKIITNFLKFVSYIIIFSLLFGPIFIIFHICLYFLIMFRKKTVFRLFFTFSL